MEGKKRGRKGLGLSASAMKRRKKAQDKKRREEMKKVEMSLATHDRWMSLARDRGLSGPQLVVAVLDAVDQGLLFSSKPEPGTPAEVCKEGGKESMPASAAELSCRPGTSGAQKGVVATPMTDSAVEMRVPTREAQLLSTPLDSPCLVDKRPAYSSSDIDARSGISGIEQLGESDGTGQTGGQGDDVLSARSSDNNHDVSFTYTMKGDFIYPDDVEYDDDIEDEDYDLEAELSLETSDCEGLPIIAIGEEVFNLHDQPPQPADTTRSGLHKRVEAAEEAAGSTFHLVEESELLRLASRFYVKCPKCQEEPLEISLARCASATHIHWTCPSGHLTQMCTQRTLNRVHTGDIKMSASIVLSGNNYAKVAMLAEQTGFGMPNRNTFFQIQNKYVCPAVDDLAGRMMEANVAKHSASEEGVVLLGDGRNDSPGHCAQYLTYIFMEETTGDLIHASFKDKRQTGGSSNKMEPLAFFEGVETLQDKGLKIKEVVTDAHPEITAKMRNKRPEIKHSHDTWHGGKNLGKKLAKISGKAANRPLIAWNKDIVNHWWFCSQTCSGNCLLFKEKWRGLLHHVVDEHEWSSGGGVGPGRCEHGEIVQTKPYLDKGSPPHKALAEVVMDQALLKKVPYYINFRHTGEIESVNNHILMYCSKRFSFGYPGYKCRNLLAMIDYQHHKDRPVILKDDGQEKYVARWSKRANAYVAVKCREQKTYTYIPDLVRDIMERRLTDPTPLSTLLPLQPDDPRVVAPRLAPHSPPPVDEILKRRHVSRF